MNTFEKIISRYKKEKEAAVSIRNVIKKQAEHARSRMLHYQGVAARFAEREEAFKKKLEHHNLPDWKKEVLSPLLKEVNSLTGCNFETESLTATGLRADVMTVDHTSTNKPMYLTFTLGNDYTVLVDTGKRNERFKKGTLGELNGFNNITKQVTRTQDIVEVLAGKYPDSFKDGKVIKQE